MKHSALLVFLFCVAIASCRKDPLPGIDGTIVSATSPLDTVRPENFIAGVSNRYFPLVPGRRLEYVRTIVRDADTIQQQVLREITSLVEAVQGVNCMVVREAVSENGVPVSNVTEWYAQDVEGNVWKFGESIRSAAGGIVDTAGSWMAGRDSAKAGIMMHASPVSQAGVPYYQEFLPGVAEDQGLVLDTLSVVSVPFGEFQNCLRTLDSSALVPGASEHRFYAAGLGLVRVENVFQIGVRQELVTVTDSVSQSQVAVTIRNFSYGPSTITVPRGTRVTWTNEDNVAHTVTADDDSFSSPLLTNGATYSRVFDVPGTFPYHCIPHPHMQGTVIVE